MTSSQHAPYALGYTHTTIRWAIRCQPARGSKSANTSVSADRRLQLACVKSESLVTVGQHYDGEYVPGPCTHRPSSDESWLYPK
jgi:hypothetical protein